MFRILNLVSVIGLLAAAGAVYQVKYSAAFEAQRISKIRDEIHAERDKIAMLNAEWARRIAPDRIQALAEHHLDMQPLDVSRMDTLASLPTKPEQNGDALGGMIEALTDGPSGAAAISTSKPAPATTEKPAPRPAPVAQARPGNGALPLSAVPAAGAVTSGAKILGAPLAPPSSAPMNSGGAASIVPLLPPAAVGQ